MSKNIQWSLIQSSVSYFKYDGKFYVVFGAWCMADALTIFIILELINVISLAKPMESWVNPHNCSSSELYIMHI